MIGLFLAARRLLLLHCDLRPSPNQNYRRHWCWDLGWRQRWLYLELGYFEEIEVIWKRIFSVKLPDRMKFCGNDNYFHICLRKILPVIRRATLARQMTRTTATETDSGACAPSTTAPPPFSWPPLGDSAPDRIRSASSSENLKILSICHIFVARESTFWNWI